MKIEKDRVVSITYVLRQDSESGSLVEQVNEDNPLTFIFGVGGMLPKFEAYLGDLKAGDNFKFGLNSEDAYGPVVENAVVDIPISIFEVDGEIDRNILSIGNMVPMMDNEGNRLNGVVKDIAEDKVKMDFNHPMAGKDLFFEGKVTEVRDATPEELSHGHVHGHGGCESGECQDGECKDDNCDNDHSDGCCCGH